MARPSFNLVGSLLIVTLIVALWSVLLGVAERFVPGWQGRDLLVALTLVAIEATYVQHVMRRERMWLAEGMRYLVVEFVALLVLMRIVALAGYSPEALASWARGLLVWPLAFFDVTYLAYIGAGMLVGIFGHAFARDLDELLPREFERPGDDRDANVRLLAQVSGDRLEALGRLSGRFTAGGFVVLLGLALRTVNIERLGEPGLPLDWGAALAASAYFGSGFLLYSQARLALLQSRWRLEGVRVSGNVGRRWTLGSLLLIGGVLGGAALLPRSYGVGLFDAFGLLLQGLSYLLVLIGYLIVTLISLLALIPVLLIALFTGEAGATPPPAELVAPPPQPPAELVEGVPPLLPALIFWGCAIFLVRAAPPGAGAGARAGAAGAAVGGATRAVRRGASLGRAGRRAAAGTRGERARADAPQAQDAAAAGSKPARGAARALRGTARAGAAARLRQGGGADPVRVCA
jgi:hypothetical protein